MDKILTVVICAYNMEQYIQNALESCLIKDLDKLEILIMNDGSTDRTAEIAEEFCQKYPNSFRLINKENGGWGSNVNQAISIGTGKYFRILDADDWFDTDNLQKFVEQLQEIEAELVASLYAHWFEGMREVHHKSWEQNAGKQLVLNDVEVYVHLSIWGVTFRSDILKGHPVNLPEHTLYTDTLFIIKMLPYVKNVWFCDYVVYNYRLGRVGQSISRENIRKHYLELVNVLYEEMDYYVVSGEKNCNNSIHMLNRLSRTYESNIEQLLKMTGYKEIDVKRLIRECEHKIKDKIPALYYKTGERKFLKILRMTNYRTVWMVNLILKIKHRNELVQM